MTLLKVNIVKQTVHLTMFEMGLSFSHLRMKKCYLGSSESFFRPILEMRISLISISLFTGRATKSISDCYHACSINKIENFF